MNTPTTPPPAPSLTLADILDAAVKEHCEQQGKMARIQALKNRIKEIEQEIEEIEKADPPWYEPKWVTMLRPMVAEAIIESQRAGDETSTAVTP